MEFYNKVKSQQDQPDQGRAEGKCFYGRWYATGGKCIGEDLLYRREWTDGGRSTYGFHRQTPTLELKTPSLEYSRESVEETPYAEYTIQVQAEGFENTEIAGTQVLPGVVAAQSIKMGISGRSIF